MNETKTINRSPRKASPQQKLLTLSQAEAETGIPYPSLRDLIQAGTIPIVRFEGSRRIWLRRADIDQLIERSVERHPGISA